MSAASLGASPAPGGVRFPVRTVPRPLGLLRDSDPSKFMPEKNSMPKPRPDTRTTYLRSEHEGVIAFIYDEGAVLVHEYATGNVQVYAPKRAREIWNHRVKFGFRPASGDEIREYFKTGGVYHREFVQA